MRGVPLTPEQLATAARVWAETGNLSAAARAAGCDEGALRRRLAPEDPKRSDLHARAVARGLVTGRKRLTETVRRMGDLLLGEIAAGSMEPKDLAGLARALAQCVGTIATLDARIDSRRQAGLTRAQTRANIERLRAEVRKLEKDGQSGVAALVDAITALPPAERLALSAELRARAAQTGEATLAGARPVAAGG